MMTVDGTSVVMVGGVVGAVRSVVARRVVAIHFWQLQTSKLPDCARAATFAWRRRFKRRRIEEYCATSDFHIDFKIDLF